MRAVAIWSANVVISLCLLISGIITCAIQGWHTEFPHLLKEGTLLFFATTLSTSHFFRYCVQGRTRVKTAIAVILFALLIVILFACATVYSNMIPTVLGKAKDPMSLSLILSWSIVMAATAAVYSFCITIGIEKQRRHT